MAVVWPSYDSGEITAADLGAATEEELDALDARVTALESAGA